MYAADTLPLHSTLVGDSRQVLRSLPTGVFHTCVTSPPYYGLRDYGIEGQAGLEPTPEEYVAGMVEVFREVRRVLRDDGTLWLNVGDSYTSGGRTWRAPDRKVTGRAMSQRPDTPEGLKPKDLIGIPWMIAFALRADGWYLRSDIIWHKANPMPESTVDRPTAAHEHVFLLSKAPRYFYDYIAAQEIAVGQNEHDLTGGRYAPPGQAAHTGSRKALRKATESRHRSSIPGGQSMQASPNGLRRSRNVWTLPTQPFKGAHFATMPPQLAIECIEAGTGEGGVCVCCGRPWWRDQLSLITTWSRQCSCVVGSAPATVLDPFAGAGTTALAAQQLGRSSLGIELNPSYVEMAQRRLTGARK